MTEYTSHNPEETKKIANDLAKSLPSGQIFALNGELGAGKTTFSQGFVITSYSIHYTKLYEL